MIRTFLAIAALAQATPTPPASPAPAAMAEVERVGSTPLWPGFDPRKVPVAIFDGTQTWLFHHPHPPDGFVPVAASPGAFVHAGRIPEIAANSSVSIGGVPTATVILATGTAQTPLQAAALVVHEAFHVFQRQHHPSWQANEADSFTYPVEDAGALSLRLLETTTLREALDAQSDDASAGWAAAALALRRARFGRIGADAASYERGSEMNEGLAEYLQRKVDGTPAAEALPAGDFPTEQVRARTYRTGRALALLLDRLHPVWQATLEGGDRRSLDELLADALARAGAEPAEIGEDEREAAWLDALRDVARLGKARAQRRVAFLAAPGWRVLVESAGVPLQLEGFDPMNVERVGPLEVLHTRWLKLRNASGSIEVLGHAALTESAGTHPLLDGVHRITITGLAQAPEPSLAAGAVGLTAAGVTLRFAGAHAVVSGQTLTITLAP